MTSEANAAERPCRPYIRWERGIVDETAVFAPLIDGLVELGVEPLYPKRLATASISVVTAHQFNKAAKDFGDDFKPAKFARDFLSHAGKNPMRSVTAPVKRVVLLPRYERRRLHISKLSLVLDSPALQNELSTANALLGQEPFESEVHISFMNIATPETKRKRRSLLASLAHAIPEELRIEPIVQKTVASDGTTTFRDLRSLRHEYRVDRLKQQFSPNHLGQQLMSLFCSRPD